MFRVLGTVGFGVGTIFFGFHNAGDTVSLLWNGSAALFFAGAAYVTYKEIVNKNKESGLVNGTADGN